MAKGKVKTWNEDRGFGFIAPDDGGADVFVHVSEFEKAGLGSPNVGDRISFDIETNKRSGKPAATNVKRG